MLGSSKLRDLAFVVGPESIAFYGAITPAWKTVDAVEEAAQTLYDHGVERQPGERHRHEDEAQRQHAGERRGTRRDEVGQ